jgi:ribose transport system permease protein
MKTTKLIAYSGLSVAVVTVVTMVVQIPIPQTKGYINLGDAVILVFAMLFGAKIGMIGGGNKISALYSGINVERIKFSVMVLNGALAALAGMLYAGRLHGARYTLGETDLMTVIAAVIIGGTSMSGGRGSVIGSIVGSLIMGMINNGLILMGLSVDQQMIFRGLIIIIAVSLTMREKKK